MQVILLMLGTFMDVVAMMLVTLPLYMPVIYALGFDPVWFAVIMLLNLEMADVSPPFGLGLFVMKGVAPPGTTMGDIYRAVLPFLACDLIGNDIDYRLSHAGALAAKSDALTTRYEYW